MGTSPAIDLWTVGYGNDVATTLPLEVFIQRNFVADFFRQKLNFTGTNSDIVFLCSFWRLRGNVHGSSMARWKARGRLPISADWTFFASYHGWGAMSRYWSKFSCLKGGWSLWTQISGGKGHPPPTIFGTRKVEFLCYRMVKKIAEKFNRLSRMHQRHRQTTDRRQTELRWQEANVNASSHPLTTLLRPSSVVCRLSVCL